MISSIILAILITTIAADNLALLSGTLRTYQRAACDGDVVALRCPPGTSISVQLAQYGRGGTSPQLCPNLPVHTTPPSSYSEQQQGVSPCLWPNALQYSLLQTVVEACQKKRSCKFHTSPKVFGGDPCPGVRKYVEVAYKCRPYEFRSKVACMNDVVQLKCNPNSRIAIYSASFGRTEYESIQCPQPQGVPEETCLMSYATETVMQLCHGKRRCSLSADKATFGDPCSENSRMYLKVVYTCVPRRVLKERYEEQPEEDEEILAGAATPDYEDEDFDSEMGEPVNVSPAPAAAGPELSGTRIHSNSSFPLPPPKPSVAPNPGRARGKNTNQDNQEKFYLYLILSVSAGLLLFLGVVIGRLVVQRQRARARAKFHVSEPLPNGFADEISEIDADIDLTTTVPPPPPMIPPNSTVGRPDEVVRYSNSRGPSGTNTIRRQDSDTNPRSLQRPGNSQYYYG